MADRRIQAREAIGVKRQLEGGSNAGFALCDL